MADIDEVSERLGVMQAEIRALGTNLEAMRQDHRVLSEKMDTHREDVRRRWEDLRGHILHVEHLGRTLEGHDGSGGLLKQMQDFSDLLQRSRGAWRLLVWLGGFATAVAGFVYFLTALWRSH